MQPISILKKSSKYELEAGEVVLETKEQRNYRVAVQHAKLIQEQKDVENQIFDSLCLLLDFPTKQDADPAFPSPEEAQKFRSAIAAFQPSDYDTLIEERRIAEKCGYIFCPRPPQVQDLAGPFGKYGAVGKGRDFKIIDREKLGQKTYCSTSCVRRALYVKVQLNEEPAWLRRAGVVPEISLLLGDSETAGDNATGNDPSPQGTLREAMEALALQHGSEDVDEDQLRNAMLSLALERGERPAQVFDGHNLMRDRIVERESSKAVKFTETSAGSSTQIEGYEPMTQKGKSSG